MTMPLPPDVEELLDRHLCDFEHLEIALFLRTHSSRGWTARELLKNLPMSEDLLVRAASELRSSGLITVAEEGEPSFRYGPQTAALESAMADLAVVYRDNRVAIISRLSINAINRIKLRTVRAFSDAFVVSKNRKWDKGSTDG